MLRAPAWAWHVDWKRHCPIPQRGSFLTLWPVPLSAPGWPSLPPLTLSYPERQGRAGALLVANLGASPLPLDTKPLATALLLTEPWRPH